MMSKAPVAQTTHLRMPAPARCSRFLAQAYPHTAPRIATASMKERIVHVAGVGNRLGDSLIARPRQTAEIANHAAT